MFSRRPGPRFNRGRIATIGGAAAEETPATIMGANCIDWWRADLGVEIDTGCKNWVGQRNGLIFNNNTGVSQPTPASTGPNSTASLIFDGSNDFLDGPALARASNQCIWAVLRQLSWTSADSLINDANATLIILQRTASPNLAMSRGTPQNNNAGAAVGTFRRVQADFVGTVSDRLLVGSTNSTGGNSGSTAGTQPLLGRNAAGTTWGHYELCDLAFFDAIPSAGQLTDLNTYVTSRYGAGLV